MSYIRYKIGIDSASGSAYTRGQQFDARQASFQRDFFAGSTGIFSVRGARFGLLSPVLLQSFETSPRFVTDFITTLEIQHG
jgi:hypothetical protein